MTRDCHCFACQCKPNQVTKDAIREAREMTHHDDLLAKIKAYKWYAPVDYGQIDLSNALRAVVELHKPIKSFGDERYMACDHCEEWSTEDALQVAYPCPTIQAIEKELE